MSEIISLGCGGGRHQTLKQNFGTGGLRIHDGVKLHIDPGPGALLLSNQFGIDPTELDGVVISHSHPDHYADSEVLIEAMERGSEKGGKVIGSFSALEGKEDLGPIISKYHRRKADELIPLRPSGSVDIGDTKIEATRAEHTDPTTIGLKVFTKNGVVGYTGDTQYFDSLPEIFAECRVLIANVTRPRDRRISGHLCSKDLIELLNIIVPELTVISHMGMLFLRESPIKEANYIERSTGVKTIPGYIGTKIELGKEIGIRRESRLDDIPRLS